MQRSIWILGLTGLVGSCAPTVWSKPGATESDFEQQKAQCEYQANLATPDNGLPTSTSDAVAQGISNGMRIGNLEQMCMRANGWTPEKAEPACNGPIKFTCTKSLDGSQSCVESRC